MRISQFKCLTLYLSLATPAVWQQTKIRGRVTAVYLIVILCNNLGANAAHHRQWQKGQWQEKRRIRQMKVQDSDCSFTVLIFIQLQNSTLYPYSKVPHKPLKDINKKWSLDNLLFLNCPSYCRPPVSTDHTVLNALSTCGHYKSKTKQKNPTAVFWRCSTWTRGF